MIEHTAYCSFCGRSNTEVEVIVQGKCQRVAICNECADIVNQEIAKWRLSQNATETVQS